MLEDTNLFLERAFQTLANVKEVNFDSCRGTYGWAAESRGFSSEENIGYFISLMRRWGPKDNTRKMSKESNYHQCKATGNIDSLKFMTRTPDSDKQAKARVITRLNYLGGRKIETIKERIQKAIETQNAAKNLLSEEEERIIKMLNDSSLPYRSENLIYHSGKDFNLIYDRRYTPSIKLLRSEDGFVASTQSVADLPLIVRPLEFQLERFERLV